MVSSSSGALADLAFMEAQMGMASVETMVASGEAEVQDFLAGGMWRSPRRVQRFSVFVPVAGAGYPVDCTKFCCGV